MSDPPDILRGRVDLDGFEVSVPGPTLGPSSWLTLPFLLAWAGAWIGIAGTCAALAPALFAEDPRLWSLWIAPILGTPFAYRTLDRRLAHGRRRIPVRVQGAQLRVGADDIALADVQSARVHPHGIALHVDGRGKVMFRATLTDEAAAWLHGALTAQAARAERLKGTAPEAMGDLTRRAAERA